MSWRLEDEIRNFTSEKFIKLLLFRFRPHVMGWCRSSNLTHISCLVVVHTAITMKHKISSRPRTKQGKKSPSTTQTHNNHKKLYLRNNIRIRKFKFDCDGNEGDDSLFFFLSASLVLATPPHSLPSFDLFRDLGKGQSGSNKLMSYQIPTTSLPLSLLRLLVCRQATMNFFSLFCCSLLGVVKVKQE